MTDAKDLLVITSAGGFQCRYFIPLIYGKYNLRLVVNSDTSKERLEKQYPDADVVRADIAEPAQCNRILKGATRVYHIGPSLHPHELEMGLYMVDAAVAEQQRTGNFKHFIYSSVLNTQIRKMFNHDRKRYVEEYVIESGLNYTILNPCDFLNMPFPVKTFATMEKSEYKSFKAVETKSSFVVLEDYAEASVKVIDEGEKHYMAQYQMCSMMPTAYGQVLEDIGKAIGKDFAVSVVPFEEATDSLCEVVFGTRDVVPAVRDGVERLNLYYLRRGLKGSPNTMRWIIGREPTSHTQWIAQQMKELEAETSVTK